MAGNSSTSKGRSASGRNKHDNDANPDLSLPGIGNYVFDRTVGQGNFAKVKLAKHKLTGQEVSSLLKYRSQSKSLTRHFWMKRNWANCIVKCE